MAADDPITLMLSAEASRRLREAVADGEYGSVEDALEDALGAWGRRHEDRAEALAMIKARIAASLDDPRPSLSLADVEARMQALYRRERARNDEAA